MAQALRDVVKKTAADSLALLDPIPALVTVFPVLLRLDYFFVSPAEETHLQ